MVRAQQGAEQFLAAAGLGDEAIGEVSEAIVRAANADSQAAAPPELPERPAPVAAVPEPEPEQPAEPAADQPEQGSTEEDRTEG